MKKEQQVIERDIIILGKINLGDDLKEKKKIHT